MTIIGIFLGILLAFAFAMLLGPSGGILLLALMFGIVFSTHQRNKRIEEDLKLIKEKLGIVEKDPFNMNNEEIEEELEQELQEDSKELTELNKQIEAELEELDKKSK